jgi:D-3-phosphoglycerate dehydrogenase
MEETMKKILVTDGMAPGPVQTLKDAGFEVTEQHYEPDELATVIGNYDAIVVRSATKVREPHIDAGKAGHLKLIVRGGVGVDNIDVAYAESKGISVRNTPAASSISVAELAVGMMFSIARNIHAAHMTMVDDRWEKKLFSKGFELHGKSLGIIGTGRIGIEVAKRCYGLGMCPIRGYDKYISQVDYPQITLVPLDELLQHSEFITLHIPHAKGDPYDIGEKEFALMQDGVVLINCSRGGAVDEAAMLKALDSGKLRGAGVDVYEEEPTRNQGLRRHPKVVLTPHIGASTVEGQDRVGDEVASIIIEELK